MKATVANILDEVAHLPLGEQEYLSDTLYHRIHEERRMQISGRAKEAEKNYREGKVSSGNSNAFLKELNCD